MSSEPTEVHHAEGDHGDTMTRKRIWKVFFILLAITCVEFFIALILVPKGYMPINYANPAYIALTLVKAFYIVAFFMHLKFEKVALVYSIIVPILFNHRFDPGIDKRKSPLDYTEGIMNKISIVKKSIVLVMILALPGFLYYLLTVKGKNHYVALSYFGPKQLAKTSHKFHGKLIRDTIYHQLPDFKLKDQDGNEITAKSFDNKIFVASFFYTHCPSVCNTINKNVNALLADYKKNSMLYFASITVDPGRDSVSALKKYAKDFNPPGVKWLFLTGDTSVIYPLARKGFLVNALKVDNDNFIYSDKLILIDKQKHIRGYYSGTSSADITKLDDEIKVLIAEELLKNDKALY